MVLLMSFVARSDCRRTNNEDSYFKLVGCFISQQIQSCLVLQNLLEKDLKDQSYDLPLSVGSVGSLVSLRWSRMLGIISETPPSPSRQTEITDIFLTGKTNKWPKLRLVFLASSISTLDNSYHHCDISEVGEHLRVLYMHSHISLCKNTL